MVSPFLPYPEALSGAPRAIFDRLRLLAAEHEVWLATFVSPDERAHETELIRVGVHIYGVSRPENSLAGGVLHLWRKRARLAVGILTGRQPLLVQEFGSKALCRLLARLVTEHDFDVVMIEHILMAQYMSCTQRKANIPIVLTDHDVRAAFPGSHDLSRRMVSPIRLLFTMIDRTRWREYAKAAYKQATEVVVPTQEDARLLEKNTPGICAQVIPFGLAMPAQPAPGTNDMDLTTNFSIKRRADTLLFVGNFDHPPNRDAVSWLCSQIMPLVWQQCPSTHVWLVGRNPTPEILALNSERVKVLPDVPSVGAYLEECTLFVAPLRQGAGMRIKLLEALAAGTPTVTTTLGAQGLGAVKGRHMLVADTTADFAGCILEALADPALRTNLSKQGRELVSGKKRTLERAEALGRVLRDAVARNKANPTTGSASPDGAQK
jgi:glycosyltransferase involved in cell wall biosynthesis